MRISSEPAVRIQGWGTAVLASGMWPSLQAFVLTRLDGFAQVEVGAESQVLDVPVSFERKVLGFKQAFDFDSRTRLVLSNKDFVQWPSEGTQIEYSVSAQRISHARISVGLHTSDLDAFRALRCFVCQLLLQNGWNSYHGAIAAASFGGVLFTGDKFAGKTTSLLYALFEREWDLVCNDKAFVRSNLDGSVSACAVPVAASIRRAGSDPYGLERRASGSPDPDGRRLVSVHDLADHAGVGLRGEVRLSVVVLLQEKQTMSGYQMQREAGGEEIEIELARQFLPAQQIAQNGPLDMAPPAELWSSSELAIIRVARGHDAEGLLPAMFDLIETLGKSSLERSWLQAE